MRHFHRAAMCLAWTLAVAFPILVADTVAYGADLNDRPGATRDSPERDGIRVRPWIRPASCPDIPQSGSWEASRHSETTNCSLLWAEISTDCRGLPAPLSWLFRSVSVQLTFRCPFDVTGQCNWPIDDVRRYLDGTLYKEASSNGLSYTFTASPILTDGQLDMTLWVNGARCQAAMRRR